MRTNYILIDYENVQPGSLSSLDVEHFKVIVFVGANQTKLSFEAAAALQRMGSRAEYVKISGNGSNALDFHIAFYVGQLAATDPAAFFHIISKDTGFDPLIQHLKTKKLSVIRSQDVSEIPIVKTTHAKEPVEKLDLVVAKLQQFGAAKPRRVKTLLSTMSSIFQKQLQEPELDALLKELQAKSYVTVSDNKITYSLPASVS